MIKKPLAIVPLEWDIFDLVESTELYDVVGFFDTDTHVDTQDLLHLGEDHRWDSWKYKIPDLKVCLALDPPKIREKLTAHYGAFDLISLLSPHAHISSRAELGAACIVQRGVTIMPQVKIGKGCNFNINATIHHETRIDDYCSVGPGAILLGSVNVEKYCQIGAGSIIHQNVTLGEGCRIGAGAVVVKNVPAGITVVGVPAATINK